MLKILELKWVCAEADWKAMVGTHSVICRAHVKQSHTQLLPQQPLLHIPLQDVAIAECQCCQPGWAGTGWRHSCSRGAVPTPSLKALCKCGLGSRCSKTYLYSRPFYCPSGMGPLSTPIARFSLQPGMLKSIPCFPSYKL